ncbi:hypothetical protein CBS147321_7946 [Aspergillus niger]|nr:hypothetical protein CBS12448_9983 [Aspergillus niger]KAI2899292.1 hypothetical protein CBS11852_3493 [Aspergillus niger]KAI2937231.1 hypothetical protein CBS147321_7946 [Aspergillus niger]KAI2944527.1 hypothetical protein CBS147322_8056 [Aspergillus niger]KAI2992181.1 hypothetical protein CBS147345_10338 [Aspergillus niger]
MGCLASIILLWDGMREWLVNDKTRLPNYTTIAFLGVERGPNDLVVTCLRGGSIDRLLWSNFKDIGQLATAAVVHAGWDIRGLDDIANSIREGRFDELELKKARKNAKEKLAWINRLSSGPPSQFD